MKGLQVNHVGRQEHDVISFLSSLCGSFSHHSLGSRPTKQLASMGIPELLPPSSTSLSSSSSLACSLQLAPGETAKFIFSSVVPLRWRRGPCHAAADVLGEGPWRDVGETLLLPKHLILLFLLKGSLYCPSASKWVSKWDYSQPDHLTMGCEVKSAH